MFFPKKALWASILGLWLCLPGSAWAQESAAPLLEKIRGMYANASRFEINVYEQIASFSKVEYARPGGQKAMRYIPHISGHRRVVASYRAPDQWLFGWREDEIFLDGSRLYSAGVLGRLTGGTDFVIRSLGDEKKTRDTPIPKWGVGHQADALLQNDVIWPSVVFRSEKELRDARNPIPFENPVIEGVDKTGNKSLTTVLGTWNGGKTLVRLWVDEAAGVLVRCVEMRELGNTTNARHVHGIERLYVQSFTGGSSMNDFDVDASFGRMRTTIIKNQAKFASEEDLLSEMLSLEQAQATGLFRAQPSPTVQPKGQETAPALLDEAKLAGLVRLEGGTETGLGFIIRLRGVDFVVTNLHAVGGNERPRVTTMKGLAVPVSGVFGAIGRDLAILRIEGLNPVPALPLGENIVGLVQLGDRVVVVQKDGTQSEGVVRGVGPTRVEVDASFEPGSAGAPIFHLKSGTVIGVAGYSQQRELDALDGTSDEEAGTENKNAKGSEQRWFGFRLDGVENWELIDAARWRDQAKQLENFGAVTAALYNALHGNLKAAAREPQVNTLLERFNQAYARDGNSHDNQTRAREELMQGMRILAASGIKDLEAASVYDFFRTSEYWETSIPAQLRTRRSLVKQLETEK